MRPSLTQRVKGGWGIQLSAGVLAQHMHWLMPCIYYPVWKRGGKEGREGGVMKEEIKEGKRKEGRKGERKGKERQSLFSLVLVLPHLLPFSTVHHVTSSQLLAVAVVTPSAEIVFWKS